MGPVAMEEWKDLLRRMERTSLVIQWLRTHLPMQGMGSTPGQ